MFAQSHKRSADAGNVNVIALGIGFVGLIIAFIVAFKAFPILANATQVFETDADVVALGLTGIAPIVATVLILGLALAGLYAVYRMVQNGQTGGGM